MIENISNNGTSHAYLKTVSASVLVAPSTLHDLLALVRETGGSQAGMLQSTAGLFLQFLGLPAEEVPIDLLESEREPFVRHLRSGMYKPGSVRSYSNYVNMLLKLAATSGWTAAPFEVPTDWRMVWDALEAPSSKQIIRFAIELGRKPKNLSEDDLAAWRLQRAQAGHSLAGRKRDCSILRRAISKAGLGSHLPLVKGNLKRYGVSLVNMEAGLRMEIEEIVEWKVCTFDPDRPPNARVRPITAKGLTDHLCRLTGYVQNILEKPPITSIRDLVTRDHVTRYVKWAINTRKIQGDTLIIGLGMVQAALGHHPNYKDLDLNWMGALARQLPMEPQSAIAGRKAKKYISFAEADQIPAKIQAHRKRQKQMTACDLAISVRDELLMSWIIILPWRQRNIRECRIGGEVPNLVKAPISPFSMATVPQWIARQEAANPGGSYWQFHFDENETKTGNEVQAFLPFDLVALLEQYLDDNRSVLIRDGGDPDTLFVDEGGTAMSTDQIRDRVKGLAALHAGAPTTPHLFRDIVAYEWLLVHPEDYLTLSKILWHRSVATTLKIYGRRFDESTGVARMDDWRASRRKTAA